MVNMFNKNKHVYVGVSACLLGHKVRYDGQTKPNSFVIDVLSNVFELDAICPEVEAGLGLPRPPVQLVSSGQGLRMLGVDNPLLDVTDQISEYSRLKVESLSHLSAYVFKARSPSCGLHSPLLPEGRSAGLFAKALRIRWPDLPVIEESGLEGMVDQQAFIRKVQAYAKQRE